jgi:hypothetical protein
MKAKTIITSFVAAIALAAASLAGATPISSASSWTSSGVNVTTVSNPTADALELYYYKGNYFCAGCGNNYWNFNTVATTTGTGTFDFTYNAFDAWYMASSDVTFLVNGVQQAKFYGYDIANSVSLNVHAGDTIGVLAHEYNYDGTGFVNGTITMKNFNGAFAADVPEPASITLIGAGLFGVAGARRKRKNKQA